MRKVLSIIWVGLGISLTVPFPGAGKAADANYVKKTVRVEVTGTLDTIGSFSKSDAWCGRPLIYLTDRDRYELILENQEIKELAKKFHGKRVDLEGTLEIRPAPFYHHHLSQELRIIHVTRMVEDVGGIKTMVQVEIEGKLKEDLTEIRRPFGVSAYISFQGDRYYLKGVEKFPIPGHGWVVVKGTLEVHDDWNIVHVSELKAAENRVKSEFVNAPSN
jgi:hypothetical protein